MSRKSASFATLVLVLTGGSPAFADVRLAQIFQDNLVLQQGRPVPVWGWADPGATAEVAFAGQHVNTNAGPDGCWKAVLAPLEVSSQGRPLEVRSGGATIRRANVVVGEVWLAAGQSNMNHSGPDRATGLYPYHASPLEPGRPDVRIVRYGSGAALEPLADLDPIERGAAAWRVLPSDTAVASLDIPTGFARFLRDKLQVPVGIIHVAVSGTNQAAWMDRQTLERFPGSGDGANFYQELLAIHNGNLAKKGQSIKSWEDFERAMAAWRSAPRGRSPADMAIMNFPTALYNTRIHPLAPFALRGAIWHQGEAGPGGPYGRRLVSMVRQWREQFGQDFYFIWGTLTRDTTGAPPLVPQPTWFYRSTTNSEIRQAVEYFGNEGRATLVELYDIGDQETHFLQKAEASRRFGAAALTLAYGQQHLFSGPLKTNVTMDGGRATVVFDRVGEGLVYQPSLDGISGVYVQGKDQAYRWADVKVTGKNTIEISHPDVAEITAVGYAVNDNPHETLFNSAGYPASPFKVNMDRIPWSAHVGGIRLVALEEASTARPKVSITHVRRSGYVFQLIRSRGMAQGARATVRATIPQQWDGYVVESGSVPIEHRVHREGGAQSVTFTVPVDGSWIIVAQPGRAAELRGIDRF